MVIMANQKSNNYKGKKNNNYGKKTNYQKGQNKRNSSKRQRRDAELADTAEVVASKVNDATWYSRYPQLVLDSARISFGRPLGSPTTLSGSPVGTDISNNKVVVQDEQFVVPGVYAVHYVPGVGLSQNKNSPINRSAQKFFTFMRSRLKTTGTYEAADMMIMAMALDSLYSLYSYMKRIYGTAQLYTPINYYYPNALLRAQGVDPVEFTKGNVLMELRAFINTFAVSLGQWRIPGNIEIFNRHEWMNEGLYTDSSASKAQTYLFVPDGFYKYDNTADTGGRLVWVPMPGQFKNLTQLMSYANQFILALMGDEDAGDISGDLLNAYGEGAMRVLREVPDGYMVLPTYNQLVLNQIENANFVGLVNTDSNIISQDTQINGGGIIYEPVFHGQYNNNYNNIVTQYRNYLRVNFRVENPDPLTIIESTRLCAMTRGIMSSTGTALTCFGSDVATYWSVNTFAPDGTEITTVGGTDINPDMTNNPGVLYSAIDAVTAFDWHPALNIYTGVTDATTNTTTLTPRASVKEWDNVGYLSIKDLQALHEVVMISLFDIPNLG